MYTMASYKMIHSSNMVWDIICIYLSNSFIIFIYFSKCTALFCSGSFRNENHKDTVLLVVTLLYGASTPHPPNIEVKHELNRDQPNQPTVH